MRSLRTVGSTPQRRSTDSAPTVHHVRGRARGSVLRVWRPRGPNAPPRQPSRGARCGKRGSDVPLTGRRDVLPFSHGSELSGRRRNFQRGNGGLIAIAAPEWSTNGVAPTYRGNPMRVTGESDGATTRLRAREAPGALETVRDLAKTLSSGYGARIPLIAAFGKMTRLGRTFSNSHPLRLKSCLWRPKR